MNVTLHTHLEQREREGKREKERERIRGGQTNTRTRRPKNSDTVQEFSQNDWIIITKKLAITTPRNKMFKPHCLTGIFPAFFFFKCLPHREKKDCGREERTRRTDRLTGVSGSGSDGNKEGRKDTGKRRGGGAVGSHFLMFRHFLGPPCSRLLLLLPAGHFQKVWFLLQHLSSLRFGYSLPCLFGVALLPWQ